MFYEPVTTNRFFEKHETYEGVDRDRHDLAKIIDAFERRIRGWYIEPIEYLFTHHDPGHFAFAIMAMNCLLIDTLSQFETGEPEGTPDIFKEFVRLNLPNYSGSVSIDHYRPGRASPTALVDVADVLYHGFRCGILHQAHAPLYCGINPGTNPPQIEATNLAKYSVGATSSVPGADCPVVIMYPEHLFGELMACFARYLTNLKDTNATYDPIRATFKKKFSDSFGIDIMAATL